MWAEQGAAHSIFSGMVWVVNNLFGGYVDDGWSNVHCWQEGNTPLLLALHVNRWKPSIIEALLDAGADVNE